MSFEELVERYEAILIKHNWNGSIQRVKSKNCDITIFKLKKEENVELCAGVFFHTNNRYIPGAINIITHRVNFQIIKNLREGILWLQE